MYRKEAFESRIKGFSNPVSIRGSLAVHVLRVGIFTVAAGLEAFGLFTNDTRRAVVLGYLQPASGSVVISALRPGRLSVDVPSGADVSKGQRITRNLSFSLKICYQDEVRPPTLPVLTHRNRASPSARRAAR
jgi:hypothetical protein